jgi:putative ABC transport system permease protein
MFVRIIVVALRNLLRQPLRTLLILQGVIWGTALGVFPPAVIHGTEGFVESQAGRLGTDRLMLTQDAGAATAFDWQIAARIRALANRQVRHAAAQAVLPEEFQKCTLIAADSDAFVARGMELAAGRFFTADESSRAAAVCVLEHHAAHVLFGGPEAVGEHLDVAGVGRLKVVGVAAPAEIESDKFDEFGYQKDHPLAKLVDQLKLYVGAFEDPELRSLAGGRGIMFPHTLRPDVEPRWVELRAAPQDVLPLRELLQNELSSQGYEPVIYANAILPVIYGETIKTVIELNRAVFVLSILVGTSVVCAIMVLTVVERQREIAIRRVEGARQWHIAVQFVVETGTLCAVGALAGVPLGLLLAYVRCALEPLGSVTWTFPTTEVGVLVVVVTAVGLVGGLLPAWRAMRIDPVEMLRYE